MLHSPPGRALARPRTLRTDPPRRADLGTLLDVELRRPLLMPVRCLRKGAEAPLDGRRVLVVAEGLLLQQTQVGNRTAADLLVPGDVLCADRDAAPFHGHVRALSAAAVVSVSTGRARSLGADVTTALLAGTEAGATRLAVQHVVRQCVNLDERLRALLPSLVDRCGTVTPGGVLLPAGLSHWALAQLLGVRRPSLTTASSRWAAQGLLVRRPDHRWRVGDHALAHHG